jgi:hypothetical protein
MLKIQLTKKDESKNTNGCDASKRFTSAGFAARQPNECFATKNKQSRPFEKGRLRLWRQLTFSPKSAKESATDYL